jgi:2-haloacid dehalogenase
MDFSGYEALTFDCYGTLVDWESGLLTVLRPILNNHGETVSDDALLVQYAELETAVEGEAYRSYRAVLREVVFRLGQRLGFLPSEEEADSLAQSLPSWPPFPDTMEALKALRKRYKLWVLSNVDNDLFAGTQERLDVAFDGAVTAEEVKSYKPSPRHFEAALERIGLPKETVLHVAQSLYHDIAPAKAMGLSVVWVNRRQGRPGSGATPPAHAKPDLEVPDLRTLVELLSGR